MTLACKGPDYEFKLVQFANKNFGVKRHDQRTGLISFMSNSRDGWYPQDSVYVYTFCQFEARAQAEFALETAKHGYSYTEL